jgi:hypothetical protein
LTNRNVNERMQVWEKHERMQVWEKHERMQVWEKHERMQVWEKHERMQVREKHTTVPSNGTEHNDSSLKCLLHISGGGVRRCQPTIRVSGDAILPELIISSNLLGSLHAHINKK